MYFRTEPNVDQIVSFFSAKMGWVSFFLLRTTNWKRDWRPIETLVFRFDDKCRPWFSDVTIHLWPTFNIFGFWFSHYGKLRVKCKNSSFLRKPRGLSDFCGENKHPTMGKPPKTNVLSSRRTFLSRNITKRLSQNIWRLFEATDLGSKDLYFRTGRTSNPQSKPLPLRNNMNHWLRQNHRTSFLKGVSSKPLKNTYIACII